MGSTRGTKPNRQKLKRFDTRNNFFFGRVTMAAYIKFDGIDGECLDKDHGGWSDLLTFSQALHQPGGGATGATRRRGDVILEDVGCAKELDKSSPKIAEAVAKGRVFPKVEIHLT